MNCCINAQLIQQLLQAIFCRPFERLLFILANLTEEHTQLQILPHRQHVDNASQLHHELRCSIKWIIVGWIEHVDGPQVDELDMVGLGNCGLVQSVEMSAQANILSHSQDVADDVGIFVGTQRLNVVLLAIGKENAGVGTAELVCAIRRILVVKEIITSFLVVKSKDLKRKFNKINV